TDYLNRSVKSQMKYANKLKCKYVIVIGENETKSGLVKLKDMGTGTEKEVKLDQLKTILAE
ncbi:MAG: histidine--tRNA ligase, partial [Calditrichaeota bacterium]|nr:histidine--tRNA ligase [Calditrichota bacterium]